MQEPRPKGSTDIHARYTVLYRELISVPSYQPPDSTVLFSTKLSTLYYQVLNKKKKKKKTPYRVFETKLLYHLL